MIVLHAGVLCVLHVYYVLEEFRRRVRYPES